MQLENGKKENQVSYRLVTGKNLFLKYSDLKICLEICPFLAHFSVLHEKISFRSLSTSRTPYNNVYNMCYYFILEEL